MAPGGAVGRPATRASGGRRQCFGVTIHRRGGGERSTTPSPSPSPSAVAKGSPPPFAPHPRCPWRLVAQVAPPPPPPASSTQPVLLRLVGGPPAAPAASTDPFAPASASACERRAKPRGGRAVARGGRRRPTEGADRREEERVSEGRKERRMTTRIAPGDPSLGAEADERRPFGRRRRAKALRKKKTSKDRDRSL